MFVIYVISLVLLLDFKKKLLRLVRLLEKQMYQAFLLIVSASVTCNSFLVRTGQIIVNWTLYLPLSLTNEKFHPVLLDVYLIL